MHKSLTALFLIALAVSCGDGHYHKAENAPDAAREFIRASLDGDYQKAAFYMLSDSTNRMLLETLQRDYQQLSPEVKENYRESSIRPIEIKKIDDSTGTFTYYHTSNVKDTTTLRVVRRLGDWRVDLKSVIKL